jgi:hypothetical protein
MHASLIYSEQNMERTNALRNLVEVKTNETYPKTELCAGPEGLLFVFNFLCMIRCFQKNIHKLIPQGP